MGVDIEQYRAALGCFTGKNTCKASAKTSKVNPTKWSSKTVLLSLGKA